MTLTALTVIELNVRFVSLTGYPNTLDIGGGKAHCWHTWATYADPPWGQPELNLVVAYIKRHMGRGPNGRGFNENSLRFSNLVQRPELFEEVLGLARAEARIQQPTARDLVLEQTGRKPSELAGAQPIATVLKGIKIGGPEWQEWKAQNL